MTTNYERIKNMTVEEMNLEFLSFIPTVLENVHYTGALFKRRNKFYKRKL